VKDSKLVVCGDVDKSYLGVVEDGVIIDGLDPVESNIVEDLFDVVFRCGVADIVKLRKEDMATARGKLESIGGEKRHLDGAWKAAERCLSLGGTGREAWNVSRN
jgi:hypothetical protein